MRIRSRYIIAFGLLFGFFLLVEALAPIHIDWTKTLQLDGKNAYDLKVFVEQLNENQYFDETTRIESTLYEYFQEVEDDKTKLYFAFADDYDASSMELLSEKIKAGDDLFYVSSRFMSSYFDVEIRSHRLYYDADKPVFIELKGTKQTLDIKPNTNLFSFSNLEEKLSAEVLAYIHYESNEELIKAPVFIRIPIEEGYVYLFSEPVIFTNYYMLKEDSYKFVEAVLSVSDKEELVFFNAKIDEEADYLDGHLLKYIFRNPSLKWAWYLGLASLLVFVFFTAKRKQRIVPIDKPLENTSVDFAKTISNLFYETKDYAFAAERMKQYFLSEIRDKYHLDTQILDKTFVRNLSNKSGVSETTCQSLVDLFIKSENLQSISTTDLQAINKAIQDFYKEAEVL